MHLQIRPFQPADESAVIALWQKCDLVRPWNDPGKDIRRKLGVQPDWLIVGLIDEVLIASVMVGYDGHRGWINYLAVDPNHHQRGYGRQMMAEAERLLRQLHCPKINLQVRASNLSVIEFYRRIGFAVDEVVSLGKRLEHDDKTAA